MAPQSYWSQWAGSCDEWASSLIRWREEAAAGKACTQELRVCAGGRSPVRIGCDQVCPEDVGGGVIVPQSSGAGSSSVAGCLFQAGPVCVNVPLLLAAGAAVALLAWGRS